MRILFFVLTALLFTTSANAQKEPINLGFSEKLVSAELAETRTLNIYTPDGYDVDVDSTYQVIYLLDGSANEDFIHITGIVQFLTMFELMPKTIVVGIANVDRRRDFTYPSSNKEDLKMAPTGGSSAKFINFVEKELQPYIRSNYRTKAKVSL